MTGLLQFCGGLFKEWEMHTFRFSGNTEKGRRD
jgi:hypothetical protein